MTTTASPRVTPPLTPEPAARRRGPGTFESLADPRYRLYWAATAFGSCGQWMELVVTNWLLLEMTNSAFLIGLLNFSRAIPMLLLGLVGGTVADRFDRKITLVATQAALLVIFGSLLMVAVLGGLQAWMLFAATFLGGAAWAINQPARQSVVSDITPRERLMNAIALTSAAIQTSRIIGPSVAGVLIGLISGVGALAVLTFTYVLVVVWTVQLAIPPLRERAASAGGMLGDMKDAFAYVRRTPPIFALVMLGLIPMTFGAPYQTLIPIFVRDVYQIDATGFGLLMAAPGVGALIVTLLFATFSRFERRGTVITTCAIGFGGAVFTYAFITSPWLAFLVLAVMGFFMIGMMSLSNTMIQTLVEPDLRGRVLGLWTLNRGVMPFGSLIAGAMAAVVGAPWAMGVMGAITLLSAILLVWRLPALRQIE